MSAAAASLLCNLLLWAPVSPASYGPTPELPATTSAAFEIDGHQTEMHRPDKLQTGKQAAGSGVWGDLSWTDLEGRRWSSTDLLGKVVVLDFWATWCPPCLAEIPHLKKLREKYGDRLVLLGVALDSLDRRRLGAFLHRQGVTWPQIHATQGFQSEPATHFAVEFVPATRIVDSRGRLVASNLRGRALEVAVQSLMAATAGSP